MEEKINNNHLKRKTNIFLIFLLCSFLAWLVSKLSETYEDNTSFDLEFVNTPENLLLNEASKDAIDVKIRASGFQFMSFNFVNKKVSIDLSSVEKDHLDYFVPHEIYRIQIEKQLPGSMSLLDIDKDTLYFDFSNLFSKELPVRPDITVNLAQNYLLDGPLILKPATITINGPKDEIDTIDHVRTQAIVLTDLKDNFSKVVKIFKSDSLLNTSYSSNSTVVSAKVFRFSEKVIDIPVEVVNLPEGTVIKTFPNTVAILCKARIELLKNLNPQDFRLIADYEATNKKEDYLTVRLDKKPEGVYSVQLLKTRVEYILKRQ